MRSWLPFTDQIILSCKSITNLCDSFLLSWSVNFTGSCTSLHFLSNIYEWSLRMVTVLSYVSVIYHPVSAMQWTTTVCLVAHSNSDVLLMHWVIGWEAQLIWAAFASMSGLQLAVYWSRMALTGHVGTTGPAGKPGNIWQKVRTGKAQSL